MPKYTRNRRLSRNDGYVRPRETTQDRISSKIDLMEEFDLGVILSPARRNGAFNMLKKIKDYAEGLL